MRKGLLISDIHLLPNLEDLDFCDVSTWNLEKILVYLKEIEVEYIVIYAELKYANVLRSDFSGIELLKHLRLTPELGNINKKPILLLHWLNVVNYIDRDKENIFLFSPGIILKRLPLRGINVASINNISGDLHFDEFLINSEKDEQLSAHEFSNKISIEEFKSQSVNDNVNLLTKPIWFKKLYYHHYSNKTFDFSRTQLNREIKIWLIDDLAEEWKDGLVMVFPQATIEICKTKDEALAKVDLFKSAIDYRRELYHRNVRSFFRINAEIKEIEQSKYLLENQNQNLQNQIASFRRIIAENERIIFEKSTIFKTFINDLMQTDGLLDVLFKKDQNFTENFNQKTLDDAKSLQSLIDTIFQSKRKIEKGKNDLSSFEKKRDEISNKVNSLNSDIDKLKRQNPTSISQLKTSFEQSDFNDFDVILLDMHLTRSTEGLAPEEMDGFKILQTIQLSGIQTPIILFTATSKNLEPFFKQFPTIRFHYKKGRSLKQEFLGFIKTIYEESEVNKLISIIDEMILYPIYFTREYDFVNQRGYNLIEMNNTDGAEVKRRLNSVKANLENFKKSGINSLINNILKDMGDIQKNYRFKVKGLSNNQENKLFSKQNLDLNNIPVRCEKLNTLRNNEVHRYQQSFRIEDVKTHLVTLYDGLMFDL